MIKLLASLFLIFALALPSRAQTYGAEIPWTALHFVNASGGALPSGKLCSYVNGTTTPQDTYVTSDLTGTKNANPIIMDSSGRPTTNGIYLIAAKYTFILKTAGTTTDCTTGTTVWTADDVFDLGQLLAAGLVSFTSINNRQYCTTGATFGAKFTAAAALLPSTGGIIDCSNLQGAQSITSDVFTGQVKAITLIWPTGTASSSVSLSMPATMTWDMPRGGILSMATATTATILGEVRGSVSQHFAGSGNVSFLGAATHTRTTQCLPQWWGATGGGVTDDTTAMYNTVRMCSNVFIPDGNYLVNNVTRRIDSVTGESLPGAIWPISNQTITMSRNATITTRAYVAGDDCSGRVFSIYSVSNVTIRGGQITGNYSYPTTPAARVAACAIGSNHGIEIGNASDVTIQDMRILNNWGDAWTVSSIGDLAGVINSKNVQFLNVFATQNYRNGGSCVSADGMVVLGGEYSYTNGAASPLAGIDIEPNGLGSNITQVCRNISIIHPKFSNNGTSDIQAINPHTYGLTIDATGKFIIQNVRGAKIFDAIGASSEQGLTTFTFAGTGAATGDVLGRTDYYNSDTADGNAVVARVEGTRGPAGLTGRLDIQTRDGSTLASRLRVDEDNIITAPNSTSEFRVGVVVSAFAAGSTYANLGADNNGTIQYCSDCTVTSGADNTCAAAGTGALAVRLNGAWRCFNTQN